MTTPTKSFLMLCLVLDVTGRSDGSAQAPTPEPDPAEPAGDERLTAAPAPEATPSEPAREPKSQAPPSSPHVDLSALQLSMHGYFRAPLRIGLRDAPAGRSGPSLHTPRLLDGNYASFAYTRLQESDWSEVFLSVGNERMRGTVALMGSLYTDAAHPVPGTQLGIAQAFVTYDFRPEGLAGRLRIEVQGGAFWDRFGFFGMYDTYLFGRTHQIGEHVKLEFDVTPQLTFRLQHGVGAHLEDVDAGQAFTLLHHVMLGATIQTLELGLYLLDSFTQEALADSQRPDGRLVVLGADLKLDAAAFGKLYLALSTVRAKRALGVGGAIEVMHSFGGTGVADNYFGGLTGDGSGELLDLAFQYDYDFGRLLRGSATPGPGFALTLFGLLSHFSAASTNASGWQQKLGAELSYAALSWLGVALRYDHVDPVGPRFQALSPRLSLHSQWIYTDQIFIQYSHYFYEDAALPAGGLATLADTDVVKLQAQLSF